MGCCYDLAYVQKVTLCEEEERKEKEERQLWDREYRSQMFILFLYIKELWGGIPENRQWP
jgi:hypothetical protein